MQVHKLAWRNVWRNKRRTLITSASIFIAIFFSVILQSLNEGVWDYLIENEIKFYTGHLEVHKKGYWQNKILDNSIENPKEAEAVALSVPGIDKIDKRIEMLVLTSSGERSRTSLLWGVETDKLSTYSGFLTPESSNELSPDGLWIGENLARFLEVAIGDTIILIGQTFYGRNSAGLFPVEGILALPIPEVSHRIIITTIDFAGSFGDIKGGASSLLIRLNDRRDVDRVSAQLSEILPDFEVMSWQSILANRMKLYRLRNAGIFIFKSILFFIVGFGMLGTVLMIASERKREYGILMAIGLRKTKLMTIIVIENIYFACVGIIMGISVTYPLLAILNRYPIKTGGHLAEFMLRQNVEPLLIFSKHPSVFGYNILVVLLFAFIITFIPIIMIARLESVKAMRS